MSLVAHNECIRVPVTALATLGPFFVAAEGPYLRIYHGHNHELLATKKIFESQAIHGISVGHSESQCTLLAIWGGYLVLALEIRHQTLDNAELSVLEQINTSPAFRASDWILDLTFGPEDPPNPSFSGNTTCAAITAHDALLELIISRSDTSLCINSNELTSSTRSILYSAHILWESPDHILLAAGTAFGEIIHWSWTRHPNGESNTKTHCVFLGHEGSIFGVRISQEIEDVSTGRRKRLLASCSDDRTIRIWDALERHAGSEVDSEFQRTRHTGFSDTELEDQHHSTSKCLAIGWGHASRVWTVRFITGMNTDESVYLLSSGEDATSRLWCLKPKNGQSLRKGAWPYDLQLVDTASYHNGKNIWSTALYGLSSEPERIFCGAADSKIVCRTIPALIVRSGNTGNDGNEYSLQDIANLGKLTSENSPILQPSHQSSKKSEFFRSYAFIDETSFLLTTNTGKIYVESLQIEKRSESGSIIKASDFLEELGDLSGYSVCVSDSSLGVVFIAGAFGTVFSYRKSTSNVSNIATVNGKVGSMFANKVSDNKIVLLITLMGQKAAHLFYLDVGSSEPLKVQRQFDLQISEASTGLTVTSTALSSPLSAEDDCLFLGFRGGAIATYKIPVSGEKGEARLVNITTKVHHKEAVTSLIWSSSPGGDATNGNLISVGRDGRVTIYSIDLKRSSFTLVHNQSLPIGPSLEGIYQHNSHLLVYGFSSTAFVLYNITTEEEVLSVESGGSHRSWAFQPNHSGNGGTLVWTRASSMHVESQHCANHQVVRSGGHGREIKAVAISNEQNDTYERRQLIATGAEDTDIKIFEYIDGDLVCRRTLRKHTTGIQHLQWSKDGNYLFSSGGCEEFYIWRVREISSPGLDIGILCESVCSPESEHSDLRIMSFDIQQHQSLTSDFVITMVYSDSTIRVYTYSSDMASWHTIAAGTYFTSCLTQCASLSPTILLTAGTDGHAVFWTLPDHLDPANPSAPAKLTWKNPIKIHQNSSKTLEIHTRDDGAKLIVSGGDDGSLAFLLTTPATDTGTTGSEAHVRTHPPLILKRAHASAVTATAVLTHDLRTFIVTSGNDQWVRVWELFITPSPTFSLDIKRVTKVKTSVADVSSMAVLCRSEEGTKVVLCGVGMEVIRFECSW